MRDIGEHCDCWRRELAAVSKCQILGGDRELEAREMLRKKGGEENLLLYVRKLLR